MGVSQSNLAGLPCVSTCHCCRVWTSIAVTAALAAAGVDANQVAHVVDPS